MSLTVTRAGVHDTVQDGGRKGFRHLGINTGGVMDWYAAEMANALLGNDLLAPVVELHFPASSFLVEQPAVICLTGADFTPVIDGLPIPMYQPVAVAAGATLSFRGAVQGRWCYLAVLGQLDLPSWLHSYSTHLAAGAGGWKGSTLRREARLPFASHPGLPRLLKSQSTAPLHWKSGSLQPSRRLSFIRGPEWGYMTREAMARFTENAYTVSRQSDRMGYRLLGKPLALQQKSPLLSSAVSNGTLQLLPDGQLIALMADHQTTGGYPRIAHVITAHQPHLAQLTAGSGVLFEETGLEEAEQLLFRMKTVLADLQQECAYKMNQLL